MNQNTNVTGYVSLDAVARAAQLPPRVKQALARLAAWRILTSRDFAERYRPRTPSELAIRLNCGYGVLPLVMEQAGWEFEPRPNCGLHAAWIPPLDEELPTSFKVPQAGGQYALTALASRLDKAATAEGLPQGAEQVLNALRDQLPTGNSKG